MIPYVIDQVCKSFVFTDQYMKEFSKIKFDLSWLRGKIAAEDFLRIDAQFNEYATKNDSKMFEFGFVYAWELFHHCQESRGTLENGFIDTIIRNVQGNE